MPQPVNIVSLCPTYCRPWHVSSAVGQWLHQKHPWEQRWLLIGDDTDGLGDLTTARIRRQIVAQGHSEQLASHVHYLRLDPEYTLPEKYNSMANYALNWVCGNADLFTVWEDDDLYLSHHLSAIAHAWNLRNRPELWWGHPERAWSDYTRRLQHEPAAGRFHATLAFTVKTWDRIPWPDTLAPEFDQVLMQALREHIGKRHRYDLLSRGPQQYDWQCAPSYCFRWHSGTPHGQSFMSDHGPGWQAAAKQALRQEFQERRGAFDFMVQVDLRSRELATEAYQNSPVNLEEIAPE